MDFLDIPCLPTNGKIELCNELNEQLNAQAARLEELFLDIATDPKVTHFTFADIVAKRKSRAIVVAPKKEEEEDDSLNFQKFMDEEFTS
tara:strand:- start:1385 stop:1651 length:267 start_codon:yes stop_codon:yes gene_type:complete